MTHSFRTYRGCSAFSLVEIALALGIVSFCLLALVGMLGMGLDAGKAAQVDMLKSTAVRSVLADLQTNTRIFNAGFSTNYRFNYDGTTNATNTPFFLGCTVTKGSYAGVRAEASNSMALLKIDLYYPYTAPAQKQTTNTVNVVLVPQ